MQLTSVFLLTILSTAASAAPHISSDAVARRGKMIHCDEGTHIISTRGHSFDGTTTFDNLGGLTELLADVKTKIHPHAGRRVHYPNTSPDLPPSVLNGTQRLTKMIEDYVADCPNGKIVLLGYSEGAMVTMNTLCGTTSEGYTYTAPLAATYSKNIIAAVVYGDLTRAVNQPFDLGTCDTFGTATRTNPSLCDTYQDKIQSYCDLGDPYCCNGGTDYKVHYTYPQRYNPNATEFVASQWAAQVGR